MIKLLKKLLPLTLVIVSVAPINLYAKRSSSYGIKTSRNYAKSPSIKTTGYRAPKTYSKKAPMAGLGKPSKTNGHLKLKVTNGHFKKTSKGYTHVNSYARSK